MATDLDIVLRQLIILFSVAGVPPDLHFQPNWQSSFIPWPSYVTFYPSAIVSEQIPCLLSGHHDKEKINIFSFLFLFFLKGKTKADPETLELWNKLRLMGVIMTGSEIQWAVFDMWKTECHLLYVLLSLMWWVKLCLSPAPCFYFNNVVQQILNLTLQNGSAHSKMTHVVSDLPSLFLTYGYIKAANSFWSKYLSAKTKSLIRANFPPEEILLRDNI